MHTEALRQVAARCRSRLTGIADDYAREVTRLPGYEAAAVTDDELYDTAYQVLGLMMQMLAGDGGQARLSAVSENIGRRRAGQGLALDSLLRAVRMDFRFLWQVLRDEANDQERLALADEVATVWEAVELHTSRIQAAYIDELVGMNRRLEIERAALLRRLLLDETRDAVLIAHLGAALGLAPRGRYRLLVAAPRFAEAFRTWARKHVARDDLHSLDGIEFVIVEEGSRRELSEEVLRSAPAGLSPAIAGLENVSAGWQIARRLADVVTAPDAAATLRSHWPALAEGGLGNAWPLARIALRENLDAISDAKRAAIIDTVRVFMANGSVSGTASTLFVHRNTLLKRLQRFRELTGLDPAVPNDAAFIVLLLA